MIFGDYNHQNHPFLKCTLTLPTFDKFVHLYQLKL
jgi:hypothetical protein